tara:strand:+ start:15040 stop:16599 length:1560 start_codon:yes stop_codon:yes gene_type:complete
MATWKKVIVSGSTAELANVKVTGLSSGVVTGASGNLTTTAVNGTGNILGTSGATSVKFNSGEFTGSFKGNGSDITGISADTVANALIDGNGITDFSYNGSAERTIAIQTDGSTLTVAAGGIKISDDGVTNTQLANIAQGSIKVGGGGDAPTDLDAKTSGQILVGDGSDITSVAVSGDATLAANGAVTIAADAVTNAKLANITQGSIKVGGSGDAPTDLDAKTSGQILVGDGSDITSVAVSGDATLAANGALTIADNAIGASELDQVFTSGGGSAGTFGTTTSIPSLTIDAQGRITSASLKAISTSFEIAGDSGTANNIDGGETLTINGDNSITSVVSANTITLSIANGVVSGSSIAKTAQGTAALTTNGVAATAVGLGTATADKPQFAGVTLTAASQGTDLTLSGNLVVNGDTTTINTANLNVEDSFILLNSGSSSGADTGFVFASGSSGNSGAAFFFDSTSNRLSYAKSAAWNATAVTPSAYASLVIDSGAGQSAADPLTAKRGNIQVDGSNDIFIYV